MRQWLRHDFEAIGIPHAALTADLLLAKSLGVTRTGLYMRAADEALPEPALQQVRAHVVRIRRREPVQHLLGEWSFRGISLKVAPCTLIPRGSTECVVESIRAALALRAAPQGQLGARRLAARMLEIGTGTGCIAISVLRECGERGDQGREPLPWSSAIASSASRPEGATTEFDLEGRAITREPASRAGTSLHVVATDVVPEALDLARSNAEAAGVAKSIQFRLGSVWEPIGPDERFDIVASNPPYIADGEWASLAPEVRDHEPASALRGGVDGLRFLRPIILGAPRRLLPGGTVVVEFGTGQAGAVLALAGEAGLVDARVLDDEDGLARVLEARLPGSPPSASAS